MKKSMEWFDQKVADDTASVSHAQFVAGIKDGTIKVTAFKGNPYGLVQGKGRKIGFSLYVVFYLLAPLVLVPLWAWQQGNPWLLFGIIASWTSTFIARRLGVERRQYSYGGWLCLLTIGAWIFLGRHNHYTVFFTCGTFGFFSYMSAEEMQQQLIRESLIEDPELFDWAVSEQRIWIVTKPT